MDSNTVLHAGYFLFNHPFIAVVDMEWTFHREETNKVKGAPYLFKCID